MVLTHLACAFFMTINDTSRGKKEEEEEKQKSKH